MDAGEVLAEEHLVAAVGVDDLHDAGAELEGLLDRVGDAPGDLGALFGDDEAVDDDLDGVVAGLGEGDGLGEVADLAVDADADEAAAAGLVEEALVFALAVADEGAEDENARHPRAWRGRSRRSAERSGSRWGGCSWGSGGVRPARRGGGGSRRPP